MPITITGGKYAAAAVASVGTTTVTVSGTPFVSGDFAVPRRVDLFTALVGTEALTNGAFASDTAWTKGSGVTISSGVLNCASAALLISQVSSMVNGRQYVCSFDYTMSGGVRLRVCNALDGGSNILHTTTDLAASGAIAFTFTAGSNQNISIGADGAVFSGTLDNFSISPAGTYKGSAFVRSWTSTSVLQLESEFFNPKTGATVTQTTSDSVLVSKNWSDVAQSGIAVSGSLITISDTITFGALSREDSVAFHDESVTVANTVTTFRAQNFDIAGGFVSFGHLQSRANGTWYGGVNFLFTNTSYPNSFVARSIAARLCLWGGSHKGSGVSPLYLSSGGIASGSYGTDWSFLWLLDVMIDSTEVTCSKGNWTTGGNHILENCSFVGAGASQMLLTFANGTVLGGQFKVPLNSASPLSIFGSDFTSSFTLGAPANKRATILDVGQNALWRNYYNNVQTVNCTNLISSDFRAGQSNNPESSAASNTTVNISFSDSYTNLQDASALAAVRDSDWSVDSSGASSGSASTVALTVLRSTGTGHTQGGARGPWTYRVRKYGFNEIEGAIAESAYSLGTAGTAFNVAFGGYVNQITRSSLTDSVATALAYTGITVTDHGASPVTWNSKSWSISVVVDLATYPSRTASQVFAHIKAKIAAVAAWGGKAGLLWHVLMEESAGAYVSQRGKSGGAGASLKGVRIIDQAGNPLVGVSSMVSDDGTTYTPPVAVTLTIAANVSLAAAELRIYDLDNSPAGSLGTELSGTESCADATFPYTGSAGNTIWVQIMLAGYREFGQSLVFPATNSTFSAVLIPESDA